MHIPYDKFSIQQEHTILRCSPIFHTCKDLIFARNILFYIQNKCSQKSVLHQNNN